MGSSEMPTLPTAPEHCGIGLCTGRMKAPSWNSKWQVHTCQCDSDGYNLNGDRRASHHIAIFHSGRWTFTSCLSKTMKKLQEMPTTTRASAVAAQDSKRPIEKVPPEAELSDLTEQKTSPDEHEELTEKDSRVAEVNELTEKNTSPEKDASDAASLPFSGGLSVSVVRKERNP
ncbi:unnamed protein product [Symbiodinium sp. CCMP2592]|nr:unnamed protein product [Symbiodinium sp. CCMP2592]